MFDAGRRPMGRLFYWLLAVAMVTGSGQKSAGAAAAPQNGPASTTVADTVYLADGSTAQGNLILTVASVCNRERDGGGWRHDERGTGSERYIQCGLSAECGSESRGSVLHGGVPAWTGANEDRVLDGASNAYGEPGGGANDAGIERGGSAGFDAVCEFRASDEGE